MKKFRSALYLLSLAAAVLVAQHRSTIQPPNPKVGDRVTITYDTAAASEVHGSASEVYAVILFGRVNDLPGVLEQKMARSGDAWWVTFTLTDPSAVSLSYRFDSEEKIDDNEGKGWSTGISGKNKKILPGSHMNLAMMHLQRNYYGMKRGTDSTKAREALQAELKISPDHWKARSLFWMMELGATGDAKTKKRIAGELSRVYAKQKNNEEAVRELLDIFRMTDQNKKADEIESAWLKKNPDGFIAERKAQMEILREQDQARRAELAASYVSSFPVQRGTEPLILSAFLRAKDYANAATFIEKYPNVSPSMYNSLGYGLINKGEQIELGAGIAKKGMDKLVMGDVRTGLDFIARTRKAWKENLSGQRGMIADTYGEGLMKLGRFADAEPVMEESNALMQQDDPDNNARLAECYVKNQKFQEASDLSYAVLVKGKGNPVLVDYYRTAYVSLNGSAAGFDSVLSAARTEMRKELRAKVLKEKIEQPSVDFELKALDGSSVKLSDLRGKVVVLDFWATWCGPCLSSFPSLQKIYDRYKDHPGVKILAMNTWERVKPDIREQHVKDFMAKNNYTFPVLFDTDLVSRYGVEGIPTKFIIDKEGIVRFKDIGFGGSEEMEEKMEIQFQMLLGSEASVVK